MPYLVVEWNDTETEAKGWLVVHNLVKGYAGGGIRMHPTVTEEEVKRLAEAMAYKYVASQSETTGGCKGGIAYDYKAKDAKDVLRRFLIAMMPYIDNGVSLGSDLGTKYEDILEVFQEFGVEIPLTQTMKSDASIVQAMQAYDRLLTEKIDGLLVNDAVTGYGVAYAADEAWTFNHNHQEASVVIQGFGNVGASCALKLSELGYKIVGIADANVLVTCEKGLDVEHLFAHKNVYGEMDPESFKPEYEVMENDKWLEVPCDILIPCALEDVIHGENADRIQASLVVEGANIPTTASGDQILKEKGIDLVNDFVANIGSVRCYDAVIFGGVTPTPEAVIKDIEARCRENVHRLFTEAKEQKRYHREIAVEIFKPNKSDAIEYMANTPSQRMNP